MKAIKWGACNDCRWTVCWAEYKNSFFPFLLDKWISLPQSSVPEDVYCILVLYWHIQVLQNLHIQNCQTHLNFISIGIPVAMATAWFDRGWWCHWGIVRGSRSSWFNSCESLTERTFYNHQERKVWLMHPYVQCIKI